jgi:transcriptional regulator with XRE-family HTH domain
MKKVIAPINERIRMYRNAAGYTQEAAAEVLGMKKNTYAHMERYGNPTPALILKLAQLYNVDVNILLSGQKQHTKTESPNTSDKPEPPTRFSDYDKPLINNSSDILTATEKSVIGGFKALKPDQKRQIIELINTMREKNKKDLFEGK